MSIDICGPVWSSALWVGQNFLPPYGLVLSDEIDNQKSDDYHGELSFWIKED